MISLGIRIPHLIQAIAWHCYCNYSLFIKYTERKPILVLINTISWVICWLLFDEIDALFLDQCARIIKLHFGLKNVGATFQRAMSYAFHDIKHIVEPYLDNLPAHSQRREDHFGHLRDIFLRCRHYNIQLNLHKCVFCVETGCLLGFVVSKDGIQIDPLKISTILALPAPTNLLELQSLQGKEKFLRHFVCNFAEKTHSYMCLLKKNTPFFWDD